MFNVKKHTPPLGNYDVPTGWPMKPYKRPYGGTPEPPVMYEKSSDPEDESAGYGYSNAEELDEKDVYFYHSDHLGSTSYITDKDGNATQFVCYKPYGEALVDEHNTTHEQPWKFNGKELDSETGLYYYGARYYEPVLALWYGVDALAEKYPSMGGYVYCAGNPVKLIDPDGNAWKPDETDGTCTGYLWVKESESYDSNGNLLPGLYHQAIFFSDNGTFDSDSKYNIGSSTATVYKADGTTCSFDACTNPSNSNESATVPEGRYEANVGLHQGKYTALRMHDIGNSEGKIELGVPNPSNEKVTYAQGINIHKSGMNNFTGVGSDGRHVSRGCCLIDRDSWSDFISLFNSSTQKSNVVSVTISRSRSIPTPISKPMVVQSTITTEQSRNSVRKEGFLTQMYNFCQSICTPRF